MTIRGDVSGQTFDGIGSTAAELCATALVAGVLKEDNANGFFVDSAFQSILSDADGFLLLWFFATGFGDESVNVNVDSLSDST